METCRCASTSIMSKMRERLLQTSAELHQCCCLAGIVSNIKTSVSYSYHSILFLCIYSSYSCFLHFLFLLGGQPTEECYPSDLLREREKNTNLNKYLIRLFCDLMCFCLAGVYGNIFGPFIKALTH